MPLSTNIDSTKTSDRAGRAGQQGEAPRVGLRPDQGPAAPRAQQRARAGHGEERHQAELDRPGEREAQGHQVQNHVGDGGDHAGAAARPQGASDSTLPETENSSRRVSPRSALDLS